MGTSDKRKNRISSNNLNSIIFNYYWVVYALFSKDEIPKNITFGILVLGIGVIGMLKSAIEMFENHRKDKNANVNKVNV